MARTILQCHGNVERFHSPPEPITTCELHLDRPGIFAESPDKVFIFQRGRLPELQRSGYGVADSFISERNASGDDLSQRDASRHPKWENVIYIVNKEGKMIDSWEQHNKLFVRPHAC